MATFNSTTTSEFFATESGGGGGGGATLRSYEIDLTGSGGTLANGTLSIGGIDWTVFGVGTTTVVGIEANLSSYYADYDGALHGVELTGHVTSLTLDQTNGVFGFLRGDSTVTYFQFMVNYMVGAGTFQQIGSNVDGSSQTVVTSVTTLESYYKQWALQANGNLALGTIGDDATVAPFRLAKNSDEYFYAVTDGTRPQTQRFGTGDKIRVYSNVYSGGGVVNTVVQDANGITITLGSQVTTWKKLYLFILTPEVA